MVMPRDVVYLTDEQLDKLADKIAERVVDRAKAAHEAEMAADEPQVDLIDDGAGSQVAPGAPVTYADASDGAQGQNPNVDDTGDQTGS